MTTSIKKVGLFCPSNMLIILSLFWFLALSHAVFGQPATPAIPSVAELSSPEISAAEPSIAEPSTTEPESTAEPEIAPEPPLYSSRSERDRQLLANAAPEEVRWLDIDQQILGLFRPTENRMTKGAVLLLHAAETPSGWPAIFESARRTLPQYGWTTLAVTLPAKTTPPLPKRDPVIATVAESEATETETETLPVSPSTESEPPSVVPPTEPVAPPTETPEEPDAPIVAEQPIVPAEDPPPTRAELITTRVDAALAWLAEEGFPSVILVIDNSSVTDTWAHLQSAPNKRVAALIIMNLQAQEALTTAELEAILTAESPPVLDVFFTAEQGKMTAVRKRHRAVALRQKVDVYQQLHLQQELPVNLDDHQGFGLGRLRGFMEQQTSSYSRP